tara:strand:+ start:161 stop:1159 length:999 start_codon:yes stop_codon:yes gene_type:complete
LKFSTKISNTVLAHLEQRGLEISGVTESPTAPLELLRDPSSWIDAMQLESFLAQLEADMSSQLAGDEVFESAGLASPGLKAWGVLDSVLRLMQSEQDVYSQPQRFLSYFISPAPPIAHVERLPEGIRFQLPLSHSEYPRCCEFLRAALESLPQYIGRSASRCKWVQNQIEISWAEGQESLFQPGDVDHQLSPDLIRNMLGTLEKSQSDLHRKETELQQAKERIEELEKLIESGFQPNTTSRPVTQSDFEELRQSLLKLNDFWARSQQLVTLLVAQGRKDAQVSSAMQRVQWDRIVEAAPGKFKDTLELLDELKMEAEAKSMPALRSLPELKH